MKTDTKNFDPNQAGNLEEAICRICSRTRTSFLEIAHTKTRIRFKPDKVGVKLCLLTSRIDDEIFETLLEHFPEFSDPSKAAIINENEIKSNDGKVKWRNFLMLYENNKQIPDYNFGTLVRADAQGEYDEENTIFVPRMQFLAIEIARNKHKLNDWIYEQNKVRL